MGHGFAQRTEEGSILAPEPRVSLMTLAPVFATSRSIFIPEKKVTSGDARMMWRTGP